MIQALLFIFWQVRVGDWFSAGGWSGAVRKLQYANYDPHFRPGSAAAAAAAAAAANIETGTAASASSSKYKKPSKPTKKQAVAATSAVPVAVAAAAEPKAATAGIAVTLLVTVHKDVDEPRPVGDTIRFHRDASAIRKERDAKTKQLALTQATQATASSSDATKLTSPSTPTLKRGIKNALPNEQFATAKEAAEYAMEQSQLPVRLAAYALSPSDAQRFGLDRLRTLFSEQKPGFAFVAGTVL